MLRAAVRMLAVPHGVLRVHGASAFFAFDVGRTPHSLMDSLYQREHCSPRTLHSTAAPAADGPPCPSSHDKRPLRRPVSRCENSDRRRRSHARNPG